MSPLGDMKRVTWPPEPGVTAAGGFEGAPAEPDGGSIDAT